MILIKENHIRAAGGIAAAVAGARRAYPRLPLEVEVTDLTELAEALEHGPDRVMLDNFSPDRIPEALAVLEARFPDLADRPEVELSGGITETTVREFAGPGIDFVSSGALTHSAGALDLALEIRLLPEPEPTS
jgi:nicotinate-nucleotide pyrophosphorylase (carboxylating)